MGLTWDVGYLRTMPGMLLAGEGVISIVGGIVNIFSFGASAGLLGFLFWSTAIISGLLLLCHVCNLIQSIESKLPIFRTVQLGYIAVWLILYIVACILSFISFAISAIFAYVNVVLLVLDGFLRYRNYKSGATTAGGNSGLEDPSTAAQAAAPKY